MIKLKPDYDDHGYSSNYDEDDENVDTQQKYFKNGGLMCQTMDEGMHGTSSSCMLMVHTFVTIG